VGTLVHLNTICRQGEAKSPERLPIDSCGKDTPPFKSKLVSAND
jgi:hypothetical protein